jgi:pimeloyl-ACP methyl ester carboxylesterase
MQKIYLFGGLGVDKPVFEYIHFKNYDKKIINWIEPSTGESLESYCKKLLPQIDSENPVLAGVSFGGLVAQQISELIKVKQVILISSVRCYHEIPWYFRVLGTIRMNKIAPLGMLRKMNRLFRWFFVTKDPKYSQLIQQIVKETSPTYVKWAVNIVLQWKGDYTSEKNIQIHGDKDRTFPMRYMQRPDYIIKGAGHFMIVQNAEEIGRIIDAL